LAIEDHVKEQAVLLGKTKSLVGVVTEPEPTVAPLNKPAIVLLNAGLMHRVGPNRIYVQIARRLAESGYLSLRFDLAGIGDSGNRTDHLSLREGVLSDAKEAMDFLARQKGTGQFILIGICSGADNSLRVALNDVRVIGVVSIEPYYFSTPAYYFYFYRRRLFNRRSWGRLLSLRSDFWHILKKRVRQTRPLLGRSDRPGQAGSDRSRDSKSRILSEVEQLLSRGVNMHFVYCIHSPSYYNHHLTLRHKTASWKHFHATVFENTDHTFTLLESQRALVDAIDQWVRAVPWCQSMRNACPQGAKDATAV
jgi:alpha/beta superfamily hydrolase